VSILVSRTLVTTDSSAGDCKVKEMVGNRGEEAFRVELQLKDGHAVTLISVMGRSDCSIATGLTGVDTSRYGVFVSVNIDHFVFVVR